MTTNKENNIEQIRQLYRPEEVRILFVGESPPESGGFFYVESLMTTFVSRPFESRFNIQFKDNQDFLEFFQKQQCYLDDLCLDPIDKVSPSKRRLMSKQNVLPFSQRLSSMQPIIVISILKRIEKYVIEAIELSGVKTQFYSVPFPGFGNQNRFKDEVLGILEKHLSTI